MGAPYGKYRFQAVASINGLPKFLAGATVTVYNSATDGTAVVSDVGVVVTGATKSTLYANEAGTGTLANPVTANDVGVAEFFLGNGTYDFLVEALDGSKYGVSRISWYGKPQLSNSSIVNLKDFTTLQAAHDSLPSTGGSIFVPAGVNTITAGTIFTKPVRLFGELSSDENENKGSVIQLIDSTNNVDLITLANGSARTIIENIYFKGTGVAGNGRAIVLSNVKRIIVRNCAFYGFPSWCVDAILDTIVNIHFDNCSFWRSKSNGLVNLTTVFTYFCKFNGCDFIPEAGRGLVLGRGMWTVITGNTFERDTDAVSTDGDTQALIYIEAVAGAAGGIQSTQIINNFIENVTTNDPPNNWLIFLKGGNVNTVIRGNLFGRPNGSGYTRIIKSKNVAGGGCDNLLIDNNHITVAGTDHTGKTDDVVLESADRVVIGVNSVQDTNGYLNQMRISGGTAANIAKYSRERFKLVGLSADPTLDVSDGDMYYNTTTNKVRARAAGAWVDLH